MDRRGARHDAPLGQGRRAGGQAVVAHRAGERRATGRQLEALIRACIHDGRAIRGERPGRTAAPRSVRVAGNHAPEIDAAVVGLARGVARGGLRRRDERQLAERVAEQPQVRGWSRELVVRAGEDDQAIRCGRPGCGRPEAADRCGPAVGAHPRRCRADPVGFGEQPRVGEDVVEALLEASIAPAVHEQPVGRGIDKPRRGRSGPRARRLPVAAASTRRSRPGGPSRRGRPTGPSLRRHGLRRARACRSQRRA